MTNARGELLSIFGRIASDWKIEEGKFILQVEVPPNTTATVHLPTDSPEAVEETGKPLDSAESVRNVRVENGETVCEIGAGRYVFTAPFGG